MDHWGNKRGIKKYLKTKENESTIQKPWDRAKAVLGREFIPVQFYLKKQEKSQTTKPYTSITRERRTNKIQT